MPDPTLATISATESPALFNVSPYVTRWMLYQKFANGLDLDSEPNDRMSWGRKMQPLLLEQAAADLRLEVTPNEQDHYHRRGLLGCTRDATIICPDRGPGALETKCIFDYRTWMVDWGGGSFAPRTHEIQNQQQMLVGEAEPYRWGVIAAWVAGTMHYFEREPIDQLWTALNDEAAKFFADVADKREPDPFGSPIEIPWITSLFPTERGKVIVLEDEELAHAALHYRDAKEQESAGKRTAEPLRARLLGAAKDAAEIQLPGNVHVRIVASGKGKSVKVWSPDESAAGARTEIPEDILMSG